MGSDLLLLPTGIQWPHCIVNVIAAISATLVNGMLWRFLYALVVSFLIESNASCCELSHANAIPILHFALSAAGKCDNSQAIGLRMFS